jgi:lysophospholipase L1-like esterase
MINMYPDALWDSETALVRSEPVLFSSKEPARLLFPAEKIIQVYNPVLQKVYTEGVHFFHTPGSDLVTPVPGSGLCGLFEAGLFPDPATAKVYPAPGANAIPGGPDGKLLLFDNSHFFARHQAVIDYKVLPGTPFPGCGALAPGQLPRVCEKLKKGTGFLTVRLIGDSISEGYNSSEYTRVPPFAPPYANQFAQALKKKFRTHISLTNGAIAGTGCRGADIIESTWLPPRYDLLIIAYGMNDLGMGAENYKKQISSIIERKRALHPETEFILVSTMTRNPLWRGSADPQAAEFAKALHSLESSYCAVADLHALWRQILEKKDYYDLTGNGVNHPNDYGHQLYCKVLTDLFRNI